MQERVVVLVAHGDGDGPNLDGEAAHGLNLVERHDERAVDAHEAPGGQLFLHRLEAHEREQGAGRAFEVNFDVILEALDVKNVAEGDAHQLVLGLEEEVLFFVGASGGGGAGVLAGELSIGAGLAPDKYMA